MLRSRVHIPTALCLFVLCCQSPSRAGSIDKDIAYQLAIRATNRLAQDQEDPEGQFLLSAAGRINPRSKTYLLTSGLIQRGLKPEPMKKGVSERELTTALLKRAVQLQERYQRRKDDTELAAQCALYYGLVEYFQPKNRTVILGVMWLRSHGVETDLGELLSVPVPRRPGVIDPLRSRASLYLPLDADEVLALPAKRVRAESEDDPVFVKGKSGEALQVRRRGDAAGIVAVEGKDLLPRQQGTIAFWFRPLKAYGKGQSHAFFWFCGDEATRYYLWGFAREGSFLVQRTPLPGRGGNDKVTFGSSLTTPSGRAATSWAERWHHIAVTWAPGQPARSYHDGEPFASFDGPWGLPEDAPAFTTLIIGWVDGKARYDHNQPAEALIDDFLVFPEALPEREIRELAR